MVPTPVGNLEDITLRALRVLKEVNLILCEDTRTSSILLQRHNITTPLKAFHQFNEHRQLEHFINALAHGEQIALISDAGTPGISDPGFLLVREASRKGIQVTCLPGPTAFVPALILSAFPCERFRFIGFLPHKKGRQRMLKTLVDDSETLILYESPHRLLKLLSTLLELMPNRDIAIIREISKTFEQVLRGTPEKLIAYFSSHAPKGEIVVVISSL